MNVFVDTNILIDYVCRREPFFLHAKAIFASLPLLLNNKDNIYERYRVYKKAISSLVLGYRQVAGRQ